jgi:hypothetical protein
MEPRRIPAEATRKMTYRGAAFEPSAEFRKLTASFETPTIRADTANAIRITKTNK